MQMAMMTLMKMVVVVVANVEWMRGIKLGASLPGCHFLAVGLLYLIFG